MHSLLPVLWQLALQASRLAAHATLLRTAAMLCALALGGCASLPHSVPRAASTAPVDVAWTALAGIAAAAKPEAARGLTGVRLLPDGGEAFAARLALIRRAELSLDVQYYLIASDRTGLQFLAALSEAAARGVRVRALVDDLNATGQDALFAGLARQAGFELRLFNPLPARRGGFVARFALSLHEFSRINRRMHSKVLIADNSFAILGGRNIADEYFDRSGSAGFIDMDLLVSGPVVPALSASFDAFWNSAHAYPVASLAAEAAPLPRAAAAATTNEPVQATGDDIEAEFAAGQVTRHFAPASVLADGIAQIEATAPDRPDSMVMSAHLGLLRSARSSALVATPYFVPSPGGLAALHEARARDVRLVVMTNSLSTTDEPLAHFGYARYRTGLLRIGVALHELMASGESKGRGDAEAGTWPRSLGRLHAKLLVVDERWVSIGSMNMDRRSARCNSETALLVDSPALAAEVGHFLARGRLAGSYRLRLADDGKRIEWLEGGAALRREPQPAVRPRVGPRLASFLVSEDWL